MALKDNLIDLSNGWPSGYTPIDSSPVAETVPQPRPQSRMRTSLPSTNADADLIQQNESGSKQNPQFRMLPIQPIQGSITVTTGGGSSSSSSSGSGSGGTTGTGAASVSLAIPAIAAQSLLQSSVKMSQSFQLLSISANNPCCVRLYGSRAAQTFDAARSVDAPVAAEIGQNIIIDVVLDTNPYIWYSQNIVGANLVFPQTSTIYITVINDNSTELSGTNISLTYVPIES